MMRGQVIAPRGNQRALTVDADGYYRFSVGHNGSTRVHSLAAIQWFGSYDEGLEVRHLDGNQKNNRRENLALGTATQNAFDKTATQRREHAQKAAAARRRFTDEQIAEIRRKFAAGVSQKTLIAEFGGTKSSMSGICTNRLYPPSS